ncbi:hypothetical protein ZIOFF_040142 [Zingiber officinale]|uniref:Uncharacterized protein n=1 Tax=Zingiber officinale TaxID=94328 RepID=A0A8J5GC74_ZINOF|nr:hypothetical protein ZIOFF_040142 [Zingiber officinale]
MPNFQRQSHLMKAPKLGCRRAVLLAPKMAAAAATTTTSSPDWSQKLLAGFRRMLGGLMAVSPPARRPRRASIQAVPEAPKTSCSYYNLYPLDAHYEEAITDCIEFLNKSSNCGWRGRFTSEDV